jgi:hypothetical protein
MPPKKKNVDNEQAIEYRKYGEDTVWVLNNLTDEQRIEVNEARIDPLVMMKMRDAALEMGFVITLKFNSAFGAWGCSYVCNAKNMKNTGLAVSGNSQLGGTDAEFVALYKLFNIANGDLTQIAPSGNRWKRG